MQLNSVVFPAPFGPIRPKIVHLEADPGDGAQPSKALVDAIEHEQRHVGHQVAFPLRLMKGNESSRVPSTPSGRNTISKISNSA